MAEKYITAFGQIAKESNTILLPANMGDPGSMVAQAMSIYGKPATKALPTVVEEKEDVTDLEHHISEVNINLDWKAACVQHLHFLWYFVQGRLIFFAILYRSAHIYSENKGGTQDRIIKCDTKSLKTTYEFQNIVLSNPSWNSLDLEVKFRRSS